MTTTLAPSFLRASGSAAAITGATGVAAKWSIVDGVRKPAQDRTHALQHDDRRNA
jgi:hypothetical protein